MKQPIVLREYLKYYLHSDFIEDKDKKRILAWLGYNTGRWIYIIDAYNDLEKDVKKNDYNTFKAKYEDKNAQEIKRHD